MNRLQFSLILVILFGSSSIFTARSEPKPNVIIFLVDDLGWKDVEFMGSTYYKTPNIDKMAAGGMVFTNAYANAPNCAPTRASLMSGLYTPRHGIYTVASPARGKAEDRRLVPSPNRNQLAGKFITLAEALKDNGYTNGHIGKWHLGSDEQTSPQAQGFEVNIAGNQAGHPKSYFSPYNNPNLKDGLDNEYLTDRLTDEALKFIEDNREKPFFLYFSHYAVHTPIQAKPDLTRKYANKAVQGGQDNPEYAAMIESMDQSLGRVMEKLHQLKLTENTLVIFFSDNGGHGAITSHYPLRGSKGMLFEGGFREPMIAWWPEHIAPGAQCDQPVIGIDFYPTIVELAGDSPQDYDLDGESLVPLFFQNDSLKREAIYWHFPAYLEGYRGIKNPEDLVRSWRAVPSGAIRKGDWKLIEDFETGALQLYNLREDISESNNQAEKRPEKREELLQDLRSWRAKVNAPVPTQLNSDYNPRD